MTNKKRVLTITGYSDMECDFFFEKDKLITVIDGNDANYRDEYFDGIFKHFDIKVQRKEPTKKQYAAMQLELSRLGWLDDDDEGDWFNG